MWIVPNKFMTDVIKDEDQRLDLIKNNLMVWGEFVALRAWKNREWNSFFQIKADNESFNNEYCSSILKGLEHDPLKIEEKEADAYADLPFLSQTNSYGYYQYVSGDFWENELSIGSKELSYLVQEIKLESIKSPKRKLWRTPLASDWYFYRMNKPRKESSWGGVETRNLNNCLAVCVHWEAQKYKTHQVNPRWFEQMMGLPIGWTDSDL
jgi:hypothetical protein